VAQYVEGVSLDEGVAAIVGLRVDVDAGDVTVSYTNLTLPKKKNE